MKINGKYAFTFLFLMVSLLSFADDDNVVSRKNKKDTPAQLVPVFSVPQIAPQLSAMEQEEQEEEEDSVVIDGALPLSVRLDSVISASRTYQSTSIKKVRSHKKGKRRKVKVTRTIARNYSLGMYVYDLTADTVLFAHNEDRMMTPASTQKLFVSAAFLKERGVDFKFLTTVTTDGSVKEDSLGHPYFKGDIYLHGSFDPTLTTEDVLAISSAIQRLDVDSIDGRIIVDDHIKARIMQEKGWEWEKMPLAEEYFYTPLTFNEGKASNRRHVRHPELYLASTVGRQLMRDGIRFSTDEPWDASMTPVGGKRQLYCIETPCTRVLHRMLKRSTNSYAEAIMMNICKDDGNWSYERCRERVRDIVLASETPLDYYRVVDGSGLSHDNKCSARSEVNLLRYVQKDNSLFDAIYNLLPIAGVDGTISKRMSKGSTLRNVRAKTGTVNAVSTLSGYVTTPDNHLLAFAILVNGTYDMGFARNLQDRLCTEMAR